MDKAAQDKLSLEEWEYKVAHYHEDWMGKVSFEDYLNWHQEWELVTVIPKSDNPKIIDCIFKRKIQQG